ncbi:hypothetical protein P170DRAFT_162813 [Aspergillus steynii IBT 23096]|uniref:Transmembrane protein n=1 Tax=Aspergillus steynii IBT 23096 TaxID=1392250 RepID=A0A2I2GEI1_9EURO|nr:uncharacterized protein P170DRAFT_162813 [Aspergillus steynii IBT 23096]PLB51237.1 hypothetical protein P170DRAFT_162813 [Aspergillus steynii IBT 23096]
MVNRFFFSSFLASNMNVHFSFFVGLPILIFSLLLSLCFYHHGKATLHLGWLLDLVDCDVYDFKRLERSWKFYLLPPGLSIVDCV